MISAAVSLYSLKGQTQVRACNPKALIPESFNREQSSNGPYAAPSGILNSQGGKP